MRAKWIPRCLAAVLLLAGTASAQTGRDAESLRHYPSPERVRADLVANAGKTRPQELEGRIAGRLQMLEGMLSNTYSRNGGYPRGFEQAPARAVQLSRAYRLEYSNLFSHKEKLNEGQRTGCNDRSQNTAGQCVYWNFSEAEEAYRYDLDQTRAVLELYFPRKYHERLLDRSPHAMRLRVEAEREAQQARIVAEEAAASDKRTARLAWGGGSLVFLLFSLAIAGGGLLMIVKAGRMGHAISKYEFDNRTDGGVVQFESYEAAQQHKLKRQGGGCLLSAGMMLFVVGLVMSLVAVLLVVGSIAG
ncbi:hypothetical protein [Stenotrophomonas daejeonensis]|uniref:hypothetical protein n=1 Tax=Stenotrophomonas daejeonensis TaxID=659018 RepID=UPI000B21DE04|nr:hypothetical protein [Stenotrophomonas daejeonensis]